MVVADPIDAQVFVNGEKLGVAPALVQVREGTKVEVSVRSVGYVDETFILTGDEKRKDVVLKPKGGARPPATANKPPDTASPPTTSKPPKPPPTTVGGGEIVNPWAN
jgi:hypothetical protein